MTDQELALDQEEQTADGAPEEELSEDKKLLAELKEAISVQRETIGPLRVKLTVTVPRDTLDQRLGKQFAELKRDSIVPGFRKGHAPLRLVEKRFGADVGEQLKSQLLGSGYLAAVEKENLKPLGDPLFWVKSKEERSGDDQKSRTVEVEKLVPFDQALDNLTMPKDGALAFSCELELKPEFELPNLEKIPVKRPAVAIDDEDVDLELKRLRMRRGTFEPVEKGPVQPDDLLYVNMRMTVGDQTIASHDNFDIAARDVRIKGVALIGLGDALVGKKNGDKIDFDAVVPDDHENIDLRGKTASFNFAIHEIKRLSLPPMDAEFLDSLGYGSEDELRDSMRALLESELDRTLRSALYDQVGQYLLENTAVEIPEGLSQRQTDRAVARRELEMLQGGVPQHEVERVRDELRASAQDKAVRDLKIYFILEKIAEDREIEVGEERINGAIAQIARRTGKRFDRVRDELTSSGGLSTLYWQLRDEKVLDMLLHDAEITEVEGPKKKSSEKPRPSPEPRPSARAPEPKKDAEPRPASRAPRLGATKSQKEKPMTEKKRHAKPESKGPRRAGAKPAAKSAANKRASKRGK